MLLKGLRVVLVNTRFPENIGMAVRACANMGCDDLKLVTPERWLPEKAAPLATPKGMNLLSRVEEKGSLLEAVGDCQCVIATTARTGGWRRAVLSPEQAAEKLVSSLERGEKACLVFGSEDRGLENSDIERCQHIVTIPTSGEASSLNLAQSVLLMLYECARRKRAGMQGQEQGQAEHTEKKEEQARQESHITLADNERLMSSLEEALLRLDVLHGSNPSYFLMPWRRLFARAGLRRHEYDAIMGLCRQILARVPKK